METIKKIYEDTWKYDNNYSGYDGFIIETDKQVIRLGIDNGQSCCEDWGYIASEDNFEDFVNSNLISINEVSTALEVNKIKLGTEYVCEGSAVFINVETTKGTLQFVLYNEHNGYYSHHYRIDSTQFDEDGYL